MITALILSGIASGCIMGAVLLIYMALNEWDVFCTCAELVISWVFMFNAILCLKFIFG